MNTNCKDCQEQLEQGFFVECCATNPSIESIATRIKQTPQPIHSAGDIVIIPPGIYAVVYAVMPAPEKSGWVYCVVTNDETSFQYFSEGLVCRKK